jgi:predicted LPLAT superfamily acyltransferase
MAAARRPASADFLHRPSQAAADLDAFKLFGQFAGVGLDRLCLRLDGFQAGGYQPGAAFPITSSFAIRRLHYNNPLKQR